MVISMEPAFWGVKRCSICSFSSNNKLRDLDNTYVLYTKLLLFFYLFWLFQKNSNIIGISETTVRANQSRISRSYDVGREVTGQKGHSDSTLHTKAKRYQQVLRNDSFWGLIKHQRTNDFKEHSLTQKWESEY